MPLILQQDIRVGDLRSNPAVLYVYADADKHIVNELTGHDNSVGLRLKVHGKHDESGHWSDIYYEGNIKQFQEDWEPIEKRLFHGGVVVLPFAMGEYMAKACPKTNKFIKSFLKKKTAQYNTHLSEVVTRE